MSLFVTAIDRGSFAAAADLYGLTASAVSKKISRLEARLGVKLLSRTTRRLELTEAGQVYFERAKQILADIHATEYAAKHTADSVRGTVRICSYAAFAERQLMPLLPELLGQNPGIRLQVRVGDRIDSGDPGDSDVIIRSAVAPSVEYVSHRMAGNPWVICASNAYLSRRGVPQTPADLKHHNCLILGDSGANHEEWLFRQQSEIYPVHVEGNFGGFGITVYEAAKAGLGIAKLAHFLVAADIRAGRLVRLLSAFMPDDQRSLYLFYRRREPTPSRIKVVVDFLLSRFNPIPPWDRELPLHQYIRPGKLGP